MHIDRARAARCCTAHGLARLTLGALRPLKARIRDAEDCAERLIESLDRTSERFTIKRYFGHGSVHRETALAGFDDIDYLLVLDPADLQTSAGTRPTPGYAIGWLRDSLIRCRAGVVEAGTLRIRDQKHSVGVIYDGRERKFRVDFVPAIASRGRAPLQIPSRARQAWIETRPRHLAQRVAEMPNPAVDAIRLLKGWRRARGPRPGFTLPSYAIEQMVAQRGDLHRLKHPLDIVDRLLEEWATSNARSRLTLIGPPQKASITLIDPHSGENLMADNDASARSALISAARRARRDIGKAVVELNHGRTGTAAGNFERLFIGGATR